MENSFYNNLLTSDEKKEIDNQILGLYQQHGSQPGLLNNLIKGYLVNFITDKLMSKTYIKPVEEIYRFL